MLAKEEYKLDPMNNKYFVSMIRTCFFCLEEAEECVGDWCPVFDNLNFVIECARYEQKRKNEEKLNESV